jgi:DNA-binding IclR family transcriptional regulator
MDNHLPVNVQQFIADYIESVEQLEILLLLSDSPNRFWTVNEVFRAIQSSSASVAERLETLSIQGFLEKDPKFSFYRYKPQSEQLSERVNELRNSYESRRVKVVEAIFSRSADRFTSLPKNRQK